MEPIKKPQDCSELQKLLPSMKYKAANDIEKAEAKLQEEVDPAFRQRLTDSLETTLKLVVESFSYQSSMDRRSSFQRKLLRLLWHQPT